MAVREAARSANFNEQSSHWDVVSSADIAADVDVLARPLMPKCSPQLVVVRNLGDAATARVDLVGEAAAAVAKPVNLGFLQQAEIPHAIKKIVNANKSGTFEIHLFWWYDGLNINPAS